MTKNLLFFDGCFDKNRLKFLISWSLVHCGEHITINLVENLKNIGYTYATEAGVSLGIDDLKIPLTKANFILDAEKEIYNTQIQYKHEYVTGVEKFQQLIDTWHRTSERLKHTVIQYFKITDILNPVYMMAFSGARGNISQVRQLIGMRGLMSDPQGQILDFPIKSNFREGLTLTEYIISCYGARKGLVDTALKTANSGYLTRRLVDVSHHIIVCDFDCKTTRGILLTDTLENKKVIIPLQIRLVGRILADDIYHTTDSIKKKKKWSDDFENRNHQISSLHHKKKIVTSIENLKQPGTVKSDTFYFYLLKMYFIEICVYAVFLQPTLIAQNKNTIDFYTLFLFLKCVSFKRNLIAGKNTEISPQLAAKIASLKKKVLVRSPLTCEIKNSICQLCYGWSLAYGKLVSLGEAVGVIAAQSIGEPGTQLTMRTFHTGGVFSGDIMSEITAPCDGIINYPRFFQGMLIRTPHGKIAFLTKVSGRFEISPLVNKVSTGKQIQQTTLAFQIPALTILFIRNHQRVTKTQVIAEFSAISNNRNQRILSRYDVKTEIEGEVLFDENANIRVTVKKSKKDKTQIKLMSRTTMNMSSVWVLSSKIYKQRMPVNILPQPGDIVNDYSIFGQYETMALHNGFLTFPIKKSEIVLDTKSQLFFPTNYESPFFQNTKKKDSNFFCKKCNSENTKSKLSTKIMLQLPLKKCTNLETKLSTTHLSTSKTFLNKTLILFSVHSIQYKKIGYFFLFSFFKNTKLYHDRFFLSNSLQDRFQNPTKLQTNLYFQSFPKKYQTQTGGIRIFDPFYIHKKMYSGEIFWIPQEFYFFISKNTVFLNTVLNKTQPANPINSNTVFSPINQIFFLQHEINEKKKYTTWSTCSTPLIFQTTSQGFLKPFYSTLSGYVQMNTIHPYKKTRKIKWILFKSTRKPNQHVKLQCKKIKTDVQKKKKVATVKNQELTSTVYQKNTYSKHTNKFIASKNFKFPNLFKNTTVELSSFSNFFKTSKVKTSTQNCIRLYTVDYQFSTFFILGLKKNLWFCFSKFKQNKKIQLTTIQNNYLPLLQSQFCFQQNFSSFPIRSCFKQTKNRIKLKIQSGWIYFPTHAKQALSQHKCISKPGKECFDSVFFDQYPVFLEYLVVKNISVQNKKSIFKKTQNLKKILHISHIYSKFFIDGSEKTKSKYSFNSDWEISLNKTFFYIYTILLFHTNCSVTQILYSKKIRSIHVKSFYKNLSVEKYLQENNTITHKLNKYRKLYFLQNRIQISIRNKLIVSDYLSVINTISHNQIFQFALLSSPIPYEAIQIKNFKIPKNKKNFGKNMFLPKFLILVRKITSYSITNSLQYKKLFAQATQSNLNLVANSTTFTKQSATYLFPTLANTDFFVKPDLKKKESQIHYFIKNITILEFSILFKLFHKSLLTQSKINLNVKSNASLIQQTKNKVLNRFTKLCKQQNKIHTPKTIYFEMAVFQQVEFSYLLPFTSLNTKFLTSSTTAFSSKQSQTKHPFEQKANKIVQTQILLSSSNSISNKQPASITNFFSPYQGEILEPIKQPPLVNPSLKFLERKNILKKLLDRDTMKKNTYLVLTDEDQISFSTDSTSFLKNTLDSTFPITSFLGKLVEYGTKIKNDLALSQSGHIVQIEKSKITLRNAQSILFSKNGFLTAQHGDLIEKNALVLSLFYQRLQTGDIVQGIPKIEQLFEARQTFQGEILVGSLHTQLQYQFYIYQTYTTLEKAARRSIENIQQKIVRNVQQVYLAQGVRIAEKHLEIIVRQMTLKVEIIRGKETLLIPGEIVDLEWIEKVNRVIKEKKNKVTYKPLIRGITQKSLDTTSFISEASFQETTRVLTRSAIQGKIDFLRGLKENVILGHLIPAGTGFMGKIIDPRKSKYISPILEPHYLSLMSYTNFRNIFSKKKVNHTHTE